MSLENEIVDYFDNEANIEHWVTLKGEYRYRCIINFLNKNSIECTWWNLTNYVKYDKRILINSFRYIIFLEEMYKSFVTKHKGKNKTKVLSLSFSNSLTEYLSIGEKAAYDNVDLNLMAKEKETIIAFRNNIVHNKVLLDRKFNGISLEDTLKIFVKILPKSYRKGFVSDINSCSKGITEDKWHILLSLED